MSSSTAAQVLLVEDDVYHAELMRDCLRDVGFEVQHATSQAEARDLLSTRRFDLLLLDMGLPDGTGLELQRWLRHWPVAPQTIFVTADELPEHAVEAMQGGAANYVIKRPNYLTRLSETVSQLLEDQRAQPVDPNRTLTESLLGHSPAMVAVRRRVIDLARGHEPVLVTGDSGTGKSVVSAAIHRCGQGQEAPFRALNCVELLPSTAASAGRRLLESARGGSVLFEEIAAAPAELLDFVTMAAHTAQRTSDAPRLLFETSHDLAVDVADGRFPSDLWLQLQGARVHIEPLSRRPEDVRTIAEAELRHLAHESGIAPLRPTDAAWERLESHTWPGNVSELLFVLRRIAASADSPELDHHDVDEALRIAHERFSPRAVAEQRERTRLRTQLIAENWNVSRVARLLGIDRSALRRKMRALGLDSPPA